MLISLIPLSLPFSTSDNEVTGSVGGWGTVRITVSVCLSVCPGFVRAVFYF